MIVLAIDPGYEQSAYVAFDGRVLHHAIVPNEALCVSLPVMARDVDVVVLETIESFGMAVGRETFETVFYTGRFYEMVEGQRERMTRRTVKLHLCQSARAQDANIRTALCDRFGGKLAAIGTKAKPGPLWGIKSHEWSALAIAVVWHDQQASPLARAQ
jgi:hypothetical protein